MSCNYQASAARRARTLAGALAFVIAGTATYTHNIRGQSDARNPTVSHGSITLVTTAVAAPRAMRELALARAKAQARTKVAIVWTSAGEVRR